MDYVLWIGFAFLVLLFAIFLFLQLSLYRNYSKYMPAKIELSSLTTGQTDANDNVVIAVPDMRKSFGLTLQDNVFMGVIAFSCLLVIPAFMVVDFFELPPWAAAYAFLASPFIWIALKKYALKTKAFIEEGLRKAEGQEVILTAQSIKVSDLLLLHQPNPTKSRYFETPWSNIKSFHIQGSTMQNRRGKTNPPVYKIKLKSGRIIDLNRERMFSIEEKFLRLIFTKSAEFGFEIQPAAIRGTSPP